MLESTLLTSSVRDFLLHNIKSLRDLEALLFVRRSPGGCDAALIAQQLGVETRAASGVLARLVARSLLQFRASGAEWTFHYTPRTSEIAEDVATLQRLYVENYSHLSELLPRDV